MSRESDPPSSPVRVQVSGTAIGEPRRLAIQAVAAIMRRTGAGHGRVAGRTEGGTRDPLSSEPVATDELRPLSARRWPRWLLIPLLVLAAGMMAWAQYRYLAYPIRYTRRDFMSLWSGGRAVLEGLDPYDPEVWLPLRARYGSTWMPDDRAPFPLWTLALMTPFSALDVDWGTAWWLVFSELLLGVSMYLLVSEVGHVRPTPAGFALLLLGGFAMRGTLLTLHVGQITVVLLTVVTLFLVWMERHRPMWAGMALALTALKPNPFLLLVPLLGLWLVWRRQWRALLGAAVGGAAMLGTTWLIQPGWLFEWFAVRGKTVATFRTPTVWGLAHAASPELWPVLGLVGAAAVTACAGWAVFRRPDWRAHEVTALGVAGSLLVTPYAWTYEHALLLVPLVLLFTRVRRRWAGWALWGGLTIALPWGLYWVATRMGSDVLSALVPALVGLVVLTTARGVRGYLEWGEQEASAATGAVVARATEMRGDVQGEV